jgi:Ca2+-binding RTX toxin-like protein
MAHLVGDDNANTITGTAFKDTIEGRGGGDFLNGMDGNDSILGESGADQLGGGIGRDTLRGGLDGDNLQGGGDLDFDQLFGDEGNDVISVLRKDFADGGDGSDYVAFYLLDLPSVNVDFSSWNSGGSFSYAGATVTGFESGTLFMGAGDDKVRAPNFAITVFGGGGQDTLLGGAGNNGLYGTETSGPQESDVLKGDDGVDALYGGPGDVLDGGAGTFDSFELSLYMTSADYDLDFGPLFSGGTVFLGDGGRVVRCESGAVSLGTGDDKVQTGSTALASGIRVTDSGGNDTLIGGDGNDNLSAGQGNDVIRGGAGIGHDTANYQYETADLPIDLNLTVRQDTGGAGMDLILGCEWVNGGQGDDRITGDNSDNKFEGYGGADTLIGGQGDDTMNAGTGGFDPATDTDRLIGGAGQDAYNGGVGDDVLVWASTFHTMAAAPDGIIGLQAGDVIDLEGIDADTTVGGNQAFTIVGALSGVAGQLAVVFSSGTTEWRMDTNGDSVADGVIQASGDHTGHSEYVL